MGAKELDTIASGAARGLHQDLRGTDDVKLRRILAVLEGSGDPAANAILLDPLRARLASLKPPRLLRFARLLLLPLDPLIVPAAHWRPGELTVPRTALDPISQSVRDGLGGDAAEIDRMIAGQTTDGLSAILAAGDRLWPRAADILGPLVDSVIDPVTPGTTSSGIPLLAGWAATGLPPAVCGPLVAAIGAVLRRAMHLRALVTNAQTGTLDADRPAIDGILTNIGRETPDGCAMITRLILTQAPHAVPLWREHVARIQNQTEKTMLNAAMARGTEQILVTMEGKSRIMDEVGSDPVASVSAQVRQIGRLLEEIERDTDSTRQSSRLRTIRNRLDQACRARFEDELRREVLAPLDVLAGPLDRDGQVGLENAARDLRGLEKAGRRVGGAADYDGLLRRACETILSTDPNALSPVRKLRLIELLAGPEAAIELHRNQANRATPAITL